MKTLFSAILIIYSICPLFAQVDMTLSNAPFQIGQELHQTIYSGQAKMPPYSTTGNANTWNFAGLDLSSSYDYIMATMDASVLPCPAEAPSATAVIKEWEVAFPNDPYYNICVLDQDSLTLIGEYDNTSVCSMMDNGILYYNFPYAYNTNFSDVYSYGSGFTYTFNSAYIAWGSITLPLEQTYNEVALFQYTDETFIQNVFYALVDGQFKVVLTLDSDGYYSFYDTDIVAAAEELPVSANAIERTSANGYALNSRTPCQWKVYNTMGQVVAMENRSISFEPQHLAAGIYLIQANDGLQHYELKIYVQP